MRRSDDDLAARAGENHDEYTRAQRCRIDAELAKSIADYKAGKSYGPFQSAAEMIADMKARLNGSKKGYVLAHSARKGERGK